MVQLVLSGADLCTLLSEGSEEGRCTDHEQADRYRAGRHALGSDTGGRAHGEGCGPRLQSVGGVLPGPLASRQGSLWVIAV